MNNEARTILADLKRISRAARNINKARTLARKAEVAFAQGRIDAERVEAVRADLARIVREEIMTAGESAVGVASLFDIANEDAAERVAAGLLS